MADPKGPWAPMQGQCLVVANRMALGFLSEQGPEYLAPTHDRPRCLIRPDEDTHLRRRRVGQEICREITVRRYL
jgi:hypothetical protein